MQKEGTRWGGNGGGGEQTKRERAVGRDWRGREKKGANERRHAGVFLQMFATVAPHGMPCRVFGTSDETRNRVK